MNPMQVIEHLYRRYDEMDRRITLHFGLIILLYLAVIGIAVKVLL